MNITEIINECAETAWDIYGLYCSSIGEDVAESFKDAPSYSRNWLKKAAELIMTGDFGGDSFDGEELHIKWYFYMDTNDWHWGPLDEEAKTHPNMLSYKLLPPEQQAKSDLIAATLKGLIAAAILTIDSDFEDEDEDEDGDNEDEDIEDEDED